MDNFRPGGANYSKPSGNGVSEFGVHDVDLALRDIVSDNVFTNTMGCATLPKIGI